MDTLDKKIIYYLDLNSRINDSELSKQLNVSKQVVNYRIKKLIENNYFLNINTMLNLSSFGLSMYVSVYGKFLCSTKSKEKEIIEYLKNHPKIGYLAILGGKYDYSIIIATKDIFEFEKTLHSIFSKYTEELKSYEISIRVLSQRFSRDYLLDKITKYQMDEKYLMNEKISNKTIDDMDRKILGLLVNNSRINYLEISSKLNIPFSTIRLRVKKLIEKKVIVSFSILPNLKKMNYLNYKLLIKINDKSENALKKIHSYAKHCKNIPWYFKTLGSHDCEMRVEVESQEKLLMITKELRDSLSGIISNIEILMVFEELKEDYGIILKE